MNDAVLAYLQILGTNVKDIEVLGRLPVTSVRMIGCKEPENITLPPNATKIELLRGLPRLSRIGFQRPAKSTWLADKTATEFWKDYDAKKK